MRALVLLPLLAACAAPVAQRPPSQSCEGRVAVRNLGPLPVEQVYASARGPADWGRDLLAPGTLPPGGVAVLPVGPGARAFRVVFADGRAGEIAGVETCDTPNLSVTPGGLRATP